MKSILVVFLLLSMDVLGQSDLKAWSKVGAPTKDLQAESIGKYTAGCLRGARDLPLNGVGYQVMRLSRKRYFGHPDLIRFIEKLGKETKAQNIGTLLIGDLGQPRGGPTLTGHKSHQTGLDVDIWFLLAKDAAQRELSQTEREKWGAPSVLNTSGTGINHMQWSSAHSKILEIAAKLPEVDRIFVNPYVKKDLCGDPANHGWLEKIRPWYKHDDHFHVRLKCPVGNKLCDKQDPVPSGHGCGSDLAWWFSDEALHPKPKPPAPKVPLPKECDSVLYD